MFASTAQILTALRDPALGETLRVYYRNTLAAAGVPGEAPKTMDARQLVETAAALFRWLATNIVGGGPERRAAAEQQADAFRARLETFGGRDELRSIQAWLGRFGQDLGREFHALRLLDARLGEAPQAWARGFSEAQLLTLALGVSSHANLGLGFRGQYTFLPNRPRTRDSTHLAGALSAVAALRHVMGEAGDDDSCYA